MAQGRERGTTQQLNGSRGAARLVRIGGVLGQRGALWGLQRHGVAGLDWTGAPGGRRAGWQGWLVWTLDGCGVAACRRSPGLLQDGGRVAVPKPSTKEAGREDEAAGSSRR
jgi:hypothetical protein